MCGEFCKFSPRAIHNEDVIFMQAFIMFLFLCEFKECLPLPPGKCNVCTGSLKSWNKHDYCIFAWALMGQVLFSRAKFSGTELLHYCFRHVQCRSVRFTSKHGHLEFFSHFRRYVTWHHILMKKMTRYYKVSIVQSIEDQLNCWYIMTLHWNSKVQISVSGQRVRRDRGVADQGRDPGHQRDTNTNIKSRGTSKAVLLWLVVDVCACKYCYAEWNA